MRQRVPSEATCAICGRHYDPSETRGWCPNPSCGEWQHPAFPIEEETGEETNEDDVPESVPMHPCPNCEKEVRADANFCSHCASQLTEAADSETDQTQEDTDGLGECPECSADLSGIPLNRLSTCPICRHDLTPLLDSTDTTTDAEIPESAIEECPNCGEDLTPIPEDMRTVCPGCRFDLEGDIKAENAPASTPLTSVVDISRGYVRRLEEVGITTVGDLVTAKPDVVSAKTGIAARRIRDWIDDAPLDPEDFSNPERGFGTERMDSAEISHSVEGKEPDSEHLSSDADMIESNSEGASTNADTEHTSSEGASTDPDTEQTDFERVSPDTDSEDGVSKDFPDAEKREFEFGRNPGELGQEDASEGRDDTLGTVESPRVDAASSSDKPRPDSGHESHDDQRPGGVNPPPEVVFEVRDEEVTVTDGETIGKEIRYAMIESGDSEDEALYVHREHVRVDIDGQVFLTRIGENSVSVNDQPIEKGERVRLEDGDAIDFSDVVTATVEIQYSQR